MPKVIDSRITWKLSCGHVCKMFGRQWTNEAKIAIFNYPIFQRTPASICINLILPETTFPGYIFVADSIWVALQIFEQFSFVRKPETPTHLLPSPKHILTQNGHSRSFKVIYFGIIEEPLMSYIAQYNKYGFRCEDSEDIASKRSENLHFRPPHSPATPCEYPHKTYLARRIPGLHFCRW